MTHSSSSSTNSGLSSTLNHGTLSVPYEEIALESRRFKGDWSSAEQTIVLIFQIDPDEEPVLDASPNDTMFLGAEDDVVALEKAWELMPALKVMPAQNGEPVPLLLESLDLQETNQVGHWWRATGTYKYDNNRAFGGSASGMPEETSASDPADANDNTLDVIKLNFQVGGGTKHITQTLLPEQYKRNDDGDVIPDFKGAIGPTKDGITGADVVDNSLLVQITAYYRPSFVDFDFISTLKGLVGKVNSNQPFLGQNAGEVLLLGVSGGISVLDVTPLTFEFSIKENKSIEGGAAGDAFPAIDILGHAILDYIYERVFTEDGGGWEFQEPKYLQVHYWYDDEDMSVLGFGGS